MDVDIVDDEAGRQYQAYVDGSLAGSISYEIRADRVRVFQHAEVDPAFSGRGVGAALVAGALDAVRARGGMMVPECPFVARYLDRHPEYRDLIAPADPAA